MKLRIAITIFISCVCSSSYAEDVNQFINPTTIISTQQTTPDDAIQASIQSALPISESHISIKVQDGVVFLSGQLDSKTDYDNVIALAKATPGISEVNTANLTIKESKNPLADILTTTRIKGALLRADWMGKDIPFWSVHVETRNNQIYLSGTLSSQAEKQNVLTIVKSIVTITQINDQIVIDDNKGIKQTRDTEANMLKSE